MFGMKDITTESRKNINLKDINSPIKTNIKFD